MSKSLDAVTIPKWGIEMTQGTIVAWHKAEGDTVKAGEEIVDIETDKIVNLSLIHISEPTRPY